MFLIVFDSSRTQNQFSHSNIIRKYVIMPRARFDSDRVPGISHAYGGALSALSVEYSLTPAANDASGEKKWTETEIVKALYLDREVVLAEDQREVVGNFD